MSQQRYLIFATASGFCGMAWSSAGIGRFLLPVNAAEECERVMRRRAPRAEPGVPPPAVSEAITGARGYFEGHETDFAHLVLDLSREDAFCQRVYAALRRVGWGQTTTYGALAKDLGCGPEAARAVGQAMARNPMPLIIPCHRVLAAGGKVGGFSAPGGASTKLQMLGLEGVQIGSRTGNDRQASFDL